MKMMSVTHVALGRVTVNWRCRRLGIRTDGLPTDHRRAIAVPRAYVIHTHQSRHAMLAAGFSGLAKIEEDAWRTVDAMAGRERRTDQTKQPSILLRSVRDWVE
jgi:hypothetical protein